METNEDYAGACFAESTRQDGPGPGCRCTSDPVTGKERIDPACETHNGPKPPHPRYCYIDGCSSTASLVVHSHPDDVLLCAGHRWIYDQSPAEEKAMDSPCRDTGCDLCSAR